MDKPSFNIVTGINDQLLISDVIMAQLNKDAQLIYFEDSLDSNDGHFEGQNIIKFVSGKTISYGAYSSSFYGPDYIRNWSRKVVPDPMRAKSGFNSFASIICSGENLTYIYNSYDIFEISESFLKSSQYSYINSAWKKWCREQYSIYHNSWCVDDKKTLAIEATRLHELSTHISKRKSFVICWHQDHWNYWHFTFDICYRLHLLCHAFSVSEVKDIDFIVVGNSLKQFQIDLIVSILGFFPDIKYYGHGVTLSSAIHIPITNQGFIDPQSCRALYSRIRSYYQTDISKRTENNQRLYIVRGNARNGRNIINEGEVIDLLSEYKFETIDPGLLTLSDQITKFSHASLVIGAHGSAFVNLPYIQEGFVVEIVDETYDPIHDYLLASHHSIPFLRLKSKFGTCKANTYSHKNFICNVEQLRRTLKTIFNS
jgi:hypothetical protein